MSRIVLKNGDIYTANDSMPWAKTLVINDDIIEYVGNDNPATDIELMEDTLVRDLNGQMVIPGFIDSHTHPGMIGKSAWHIALPWTDDLIELLEFIQKYAQNHPKEEKPFLLFEYYPTNMFDKNGPRKEILDEIVSDRPVLVQEFGEHMHWMNSCMLEKMGVNKDTPDPVPGLRMFVRDEDGELTGLGKEFVWLLFEETLYENIGWRPPLDLTPEIVKPVFDFYTAKGVTAMMAGFTEDENEIITLQELDKQGKLNTYYDGAIRCDSLEELSESIEFLEYLQKNYGNKHFKFNTMKLFLDGTNESGNCAVIEPFSNDETGMDIGKMALSEDEILQYLKILNSKNLDLHVHLVGDRAFRAMCNAYERLKKEIGGECNTLLTLAHAELIDPADMKKPAELGIIINWTCRWAGGCYGEKAKLFLGEERWNRMYQFNPIIESGGIVAFSTDLVAFNKMNLVAAPLHGIQIAHTRVDPVFPLDPTKYPGSVRLPLSARISRENLLKGSTINGAKQMRWDNIMGSLEAGKLANLVVLSENYFDVDADKIEDIQCEVVMFEGRVVSGKL